MKRILILSALAALTACSRETPDDVKNAAAMANSPGGPASAGPAGDGSALTGVPREKAPDYVGRWVGV